MRTPAPSSTGILVGAGLGAGVLLAFLGVVMAESHVPVAVPPDAPHAAGVEVATFALG